MIHTAYRHFPSRYVINKIASGRWVIDARGGKVGFRPATLTERAQLVAWPPRGSGLPPATRSV
jgi:hypothetical protein